MGHTGADRMVDERAVRTGGRMVFFRLLACLMKPRRQRLLRLAAVVGYAQVTTVIVIPQDPVNITWMLPVFLVCNWLAFEEGWLIRLSAAMLFYPIVAALNFILHVTTGGVLDRWFPDDLAGLTAKNGAITSLLACAFTLFWLLLWKLFARRLDGIRGTLDVRSWILLDVICAASMAAVFSNIYFSPDKSYLMIPGMIACIATNIGSMDLAVHLADSIRSELERKNLRFQQDYYEELERNQLQIRRLRHDMNNQLAAVGALLGEKRYPEAEEYFAQMTSRTDRAGGTPGGRRFCGQRMVNALLNLKYQEASELGADLFFHVDIDRLLGVDEISLCTIFGNTLDNALEACRKMGPDAERRISVKARYAESGYFSYEIVNTKQNEIREKKGKLLTDKEDAGSHGLGVASVREIVERYQGTMDLSYTEEEFRVVLLIEC
ncbi:MAG: GHKL domain-containing protein [Eubacteriales bacterium]|nr:GHKL domain-containing protein [Eubacteriales bacterium]